jgi:hypothetical protein
MTRNLSSLLPLTLLADAQDEDVKTFESPYFFRLKIRFFVVIPPTGALHPHGGTLWTTSNSHSWSELHPTVLLRCLACSCHINLGRGPFAPHVTRRESEEGEN